MPGYLCLCGDQQTYTSSDHCHGPHSDDCHSPTQPSSHSSHSDSAAQATPDDGKTLCPDDRENHVPVRKTVELTPSSTAGAPPLLLLLLAKLPDLNFFSLVAPSQFQLSLQSKNSRVLQAPPSVFLLRTVALLV